MTSTPAIIGDSAHLHWHNKYEKDKWGKVLYEEKQLVDQQSGQSFIVSQPVTHSDYDSHLSYQPRSEREEWVAVGITGKLLVSDDGSCQVDGYCLPNDQGIATAAEKGYRVMKRLAEDQILIMVK